jgi:hypothetical protein
MDTKAIVSLVDYENNISFDNFSIRDAVNESHHYQMEKHTDIRAIFLQKCYWFGCYFIKKSMHDTYHAEKYIKIYTHDSNPEHPHISIYLENTPSDILIRLMEINNSESFKTLGIRINIINNLVNSMISNINEIDIYQLILEVLGMDLTMFEAPDTLYKLPREFHCLSEKGDIHNRYKIAKEYFISMYINNISDIEKYIVGGYMSSSDPNKYHNNVYDIYKCFLMIDLSDTHKIKNFMQNIPEKILGLDIVVQNINKPNIIIPFKFGKIFSPANFDTDIYIGDSSSGSKSLSIWSPRIPDMIGYFKYITNDILMIQGNILVTYHGNSMDTLQITYTDDSIIITETNTYSKKHYGQGVRELMASRGTTSIPIKKYKYIIFKKQFNFI